jgi:hypothetical protein
LICIEFLSHSTSTNGERCLNGKVVKYFKAPLSKLDDKSSNLVLNR